MPNILVTIGDAFARKGKEIIEEIGDVRYVDSLQGDLTDVTVLLVGLSARIDGDVMGFDSCLGVEHGGAYRYVTAETQED